MKAMKEKLLKVLRFVIDVLLVRVLERLSAGPTKKRTEKKLP